MPRRNLVALLIAGLITLVCYHRAESIGRTQYGRMFSNFAQVMQEIDQRYVREVDRQELYDTAMHAMVNSLDKHSDYFSAKELAALNESLNRHFTGIGVRVYLHPETRLLTVNTPLVGTPAEKAGLEAGDTILEIDGVSTADKTSTECSDLIRGEEGTHVTLTVRHAGETEPVKISVLRADINIPSVEGEAIQNDGSWDFMLEEEPRIAYIRLNAFVDETLDDLIGAVEELRHRDVKGVILDVRDNPGGKLDVVVRMCDLFLDSGLIVSTNYRHGEREIYNAHRTGDEPKYPLAILVNDNSASASEILAAAMQDHHRAIIVGQRTYGKGSVQTVFPLEHGDAALKLTIAKYHRPSGKNIDRQENDTEADEWGVLPDPGYEVKLTPEEWGQLLYQRQQRDVYDPTGALQRVQHDPNLPLRAPDAVMPDPQLERAIKAINDQIKAKTGVTEPAL